MSEFFIWTMLATYAGATAFVALTTQAVKGWSVFNKIPTSFLATSWRW